MVEIKDIYEINYMRNKFSYCGLLRNAKQFNINDNVFFSSSRHDGEIFRGIIIGVELLPSENPEYKYKVKIPKELCKKKEKGLYENIICDSIFNDIEEAKRSAIEELESMSSIQKQEIVRYFDQFDKR